MKRILWLTLGVWLAILPARAVDRITATIVVTNVPAAGNTLVVNADTRTWRSSVSTPSTEVLIGANNGACATNLYFHIAAAPFANNVVLGFSGTNTVTLTGQAGGAMAASLTGTWGTITLSTQTVTTATAVRVPASAEPTPSTATNLMSQLVSDLGAYSTNKFPAGSTALLNYLDNASAQTIGGNKSFTGNLELTGTGMLLARSNAIVALDPGAYFLFATNVNILDSLGVQKWAFSSVESAKAITTFADITNKLAALKAAPNSWTGTNTFAQITNTPIVGSTITGSTLGGTVSSLSGGYYANGGATNLVSTNGATSGTFTVGGDSAFTRVNNTALANGNNAAVNFGSTSVYVKIKAGPSGAFTINGISGGRDGRVLILDNATGFSMTIANDSGVDPTPGNRILTRTGSDVSTGTGGVVTLIYDAESTRWILETFNAGGAGVTSVALSMPAPFSVSGSPIVGAGTLSVTLPAGITNAANWFGLGSTNSTLSGQASVYNLYATNNATLGVRADFLSGMDIYRNGTQFITSDSGRIYFLQGAIMRSSPYVSSGQLLRFTSDNETTLTASIDAATGNARFDGSNTIGTTITAGGTTGAQTINKASGSVNFAAGATSLVVTDSQVSTSSVILAVVATNDATLKSVQAVAGSGSFTLFANAAATAETRVNFHVTN